MLPVKIDRYDIISECGTGGMAVVYKAYDPQRQHEIALKVLMAVYYQDQEFRERFKREIAIHSSFKHEAVVPIYGYGQYKGQLYLAQRFMSGGSLGNKLSGGKILPLDEVVRLLRRITPALDSAHKQGIIHRDMKPSNILFDEQGLAYLNDFGIARMEDQPNITTMFGSSMIGSPAYMSPEQVQGIVHLDGRCDLYSLGVMVYEMLTGQLPYYDDKPIRITFDHVSKPIPDILGANPRLPPACRSFILRAMAKKPEDRFATGAEMTDALAGINNPSKHLPEMGRLPKKDVQAEPDSVKFSTPAGPHPYKPVPKPVPPPANDLRQVGAPSKPLPRPAPQPARNFQQDSIPKIKQVSNGLNGFQSRLSGNIRRFFGANLDIPYFRVPANFYLPMPTFLRPLLSQLGLPTGFYISQSNIKTFSIIFIILIVLLILVFGLSAACYLIYRIMSHGAGVH